MAFEPEELTAFEVARQAVEVYTEAVDKFEVRREFSNTLSIDTTEARARMWLELAKVEQLKRIADYFELQVHGLYLKPGNSEAEGITLPVNPLLPDQQPKEPPLAEVPF